MSEYIWLYLLIFIALTSLISGVFFLIFDLQKPKASWSIKNFAIDISLFILFITSCGFTVYVYWLFEKQIEFFTNF